MSTPTSPFYPSGMLDPRYASDISQVLWQNFFIINEGPGFTRMPSRSGGVQNSTYGPPTTGQHYVHAVWVDSLRSLWLCTESGVPGTWVQVEPPVVSSAPTVTTVGYRIIRSDLNYAQYFWNGSTWVQVYGGGAGGSDAASLGTSADGAAVYASTAGSTFQFRRVKGGENVTAVESGSSVLVDVDVDPYLHGTTQVDTLDMPVESDPGSPSSGVRFWVKTTGSDPNRFVYSMLKHADGSDVVLSSVKAIPE